MEWMLDLKNSLIHMADEDHQAVCGEDMKQMQVFMAVTTEDVCEAKGYEYCAICQLLKNDTPMGRLRRSGASSAATSGTTTPPQKCTIFEQMGVWAEKGNEGFRFVLAIIVMAIAVFPFMGAKYLLKQITARK